MSNSFQQRRAVVESSTPVVGDHYLTILNLEGHPGGRISLRTHNQLFAGSRWLAEGGGVSWVVIRPAIKRV